MPNSMPRSKYNVLSGGFSLIELMLAMLVGLIIIGGVMSLYISTRNTQRVSEDQLQLLSDARFVINTIGYDIRQAGFWGTASVTSSIVCRKGSPKCTGSDVLDLATGDCEPSWYIDLDNPVTATDNLSNFISTCTTESYKNNTDVLGVHYADSTPILTQPTNLLATDVTYIRSNYKAGGLFKGDTIPTTGPYAGLPKWKDASENKDITQNRKLVSNLYYVSDNTVQSPADGVPSLHRVELYPGPIMKDKMLISGVVDLQLQYGVDTDRRGEPGYGSVNTYVNAGTAAGGPSGDLKGMLEDPTTHVTDWSRLHSVKIWVLMRSARKDLDNPAGAQTFTLGNHGPVTYNDGHRYYMASSVVNLRNPKY